MLNVRRGHRVGGSTILAVIDVAPDLTVTAGVSPVRRAGRSLAAVTGYDFAGSVHASVDWLEGERRTIGSADALRQLLCELHEEVRAGRNPFTVGVTLDCGDLLTLGLGVAFSVLNFIGASGNPPYYQSVGDGTIQDEVVEFEFGGELTEYDGTAVIPTDRAVEAVVTFYETGRLPEFVHWAEV